MRRRLEGCEGGRKGTRGDELVILLDRLRQAQKSCRDVNLRCREILWTSAIVRTSNVPRDEGHAALIVADIVASTFRPESGVLELLDRRRFGIVRQPDSFPQTQV